MIKYVQYSATVYVVCVLLHLIYFIWSKPDGVNSEEGLRRQNFCYFGVWVVSLLCFVACWAFVLYVVVKVSLYVGKWEKLVESEINECTAQFYRVLLVEVNNKWDIQVKLMTVLFISIVQIIGSVGQYAAYLNLLLNWNLQRVSEQRKCVSSIRVGLPLDCPDPVNLRRGLNLGHAIPEADMANQKSEKKGKRRRRKVIFALPIEPEREEEQWFA